jgi:S-adenosylmethionine synthetase
MTNNNCLFSSESVARGHPDKVADQIVDAVLDDLLEKDPRARVACEAVLTTGLVLVSGEITTVAYADIPAIVRRSVCAAGYDDPRYGFDHKSCAVLTSIDEQSVDIARGVNQSEGLGAGDQGIMFGYATDETPELMPLPIMLAHRLMMRLEEARLQRILPWLRPDGKGQVSVRYREGRPVQVEAVVLAAQHDDVGIERVREGLMTEVVLKVIGPELYDAKRFPPLINQTGRFVEGGPRSDTGLSGRKIIVDTYGGMAPHGGGSFSGKDPTKVDRSGTYTARWVAKNVVAAGLAHRCLVQIAYAIGVRQPVSVAVETHGTGKVPDAEIERRIRKVFDLSPDGMIRTLNLAAPIYKRTSYFGHFGRELPEFTWERTDRAKDLQQAG